MNHVKQKRRHKLYNDNLCSPSKRHNHKKLQSWTLTIVTKNQYNFNNRIAVRLTAVSMAVGQLI